MKKLQDFTTPKFYEMGVRQLVFMLDQGLRPEHYLLDIGCGAIRAGVHFVRYLEFAHYFGLEKDPNMLAAIPTVIDEFRIGCKFNKFMVFECSDFKPPDIGIANHMWDYMLAQSVFTHLPPDQIELCLRNVKPALKPGGVLFASVALTTGKTKLGKPHPTRDNELRRTNYNINTLREIAEKCGYAIRYIEEWGHPGNLHMLKFTHDGSAK